MRRNSVVLAWGALRARQWWHMVLLPGSSLPIGSRGLELSDAWLMTKAGVIASLCLGFGYGANAIADRFGDSPGRKNPLAGYQRVPGLVWGAVVLAGILGLLFSTQLGPESAIAASVSMGAGALYSFGLRFKAIPFVSFFTNALIFAPLMFVGAEGAFTRTTTWFFVTVFTVLLMQNELLHEMGDLDDDRKMGVVSTVEQIGYRAARGFVFLLGVIGAVMLVCLFHGGVVWWAAAGCVASGVLCTLVPVAAAKRGRVLHRWFALLLGGGLYVALAVFGSRV
jgi:4-hydroxybenzoate polyprenyltransferase